MSENFVSSKDKLYPETYIDNFRELLDSISKYSSKNAFYFKNHKTNEIIKITYKQYIDDIISLSTKFLNLGLSGKRIAIISHNKYPWPVSYMAIQTGGMIGVPLDYQLPINEIELSLIRSNTEAAIFEEHFMDTFKKIRENGKKLSIRIFLAFSILLLLFFSFLYFSIVVHSVFIFPISSTIETAI